MASDVRTPVLTSIHVTTRSLVPPVPHPSVHVVHFVADH